MKKFWMSVGGLAVVFVIFVAFNLLTGATLRSGRIDLTENKLYTLSDGTRNIVGGLKDPITLRFYFSKKLAQQTPQAQGLETYAERVQELLEEYAGASKGKIKLIVSDPEPFSETEDEAVGYGLKGLPASASGEKLYFGLAGTNALDTQEVIEFFQDSREEFLEYDLTRLVYNLNNPKKRVVGILTALPMDGDPMARMTNPNASSEPWFIVETLRQSFEVRMIPATTEKLESGLDVLMLVHPQNLSAQTLFEIDQYVLKGGKVIAFVDPWCEAQQVRQNPQNPLESMMADRSSKLDPLLAAWGLEMSPDDLAADKDLALRVGDASGKGVDFVVWLGLRNNKDAASEKDVMSKDDATTSELQTVNMAYAGVLKKKADATTTVTPLFQTTKSSMRVPKSRIQFGPEPSKLLEEFATGNEKLMLAARVNGPAKTAYPEGRPKKQAGDAEAPPTPGEEVLKESKGPINVIVVADADMLSDKFWTRTQNFFGQKMNMQTADNGNFTTNAIDNLSGSNDLISLRSRGRSLRPFDKVDELRRDAESKFRQKEKDLQAKLKDAETKISELQTGKDAKSSLILSPEQEAEVARFRDEQVKTRKELRRVNLELNTGIESLKTKLVVANGVLVPVLIALIGIAVWLTRRKRMMEARSGRSGS